MKYKFTKIILLTAVVAGLTTACTPAGENIPTGKRYEFNNILDITYTPDTLTRCGGWFTDAGSWMGFTLPQKDHWVNGFCGPFSLDMNRRQWMAQSAVTVRYADQANVIFTPDSTCYFPGELYLSASSEEGKIIQRLNFFRCFYRIAPHSLRCRKGTLLNCQPMGKRDTSPNRPEYRHRPSSLR